MCTVPEPTNAMNWGSMGIGVGIHQLGENDHVEVP